MKITWLGQAGLLFEKNGYKIMVDPYFSDSVGKLQPSKSRRFPVDESFFEIKPNMMIFTHNHMDHYDPETAPRFITADSNITVLSPTSVYNEAKKLGGQNNYVCFNRHSEWTECGITVSAVKAEHSDPYAIGVIIDDGERKYYVTGDTIYNSDIFKDIPDDIYAIFLPVNGVGDNMNMTDGKRFCEKVSPKIAIPMHCGLFDNLDLNDFGYSDKVVPKPFKVIEI